MSLIRRSNVFDPLSLDLFDPFDGFPFGSGSSSSGGGSLFPSFPRTSSETAAFAGARIDWKETPEAHVFKADVPGLKKEEVKVEVEDGNVLKISGQKTREEEHKDDAWNRVERSFGSFMRRFRLPENAKAEGIRCTMQDGVLRVVVPKDEDAQKQRNVRSIDIA
jgi:HSP20 family protein